MSNRKMKWYGERTRGPLDGKEIQIKKKKHKQTPQHNHQKPKTPKNTKHDPNNLFVLNPHHPKGNPKNKNPCLHLSSR